MRHLVLLACIFFFGANLDAHAQAVSESQQSGSCYSIQDREAQQKCLRESIRKKAEQPAYTAPAAKPEQAEAPQKSQAAGKSCCKICRKGKPCGNSCISARYTCHKGPGCAC